MKKYIHFHIFTLTLVLLGSAGIGFAEPTAEAVHTTWRLYADKTIASHDNQIVEAFGNVVLDRGEDYIKADYARYYQATKWVYLKGKIDAKFQGDFLKAEEAEFDLNTNIGWLKNGQVFMDDPHMYFEGALLKKTGPDTYEFREATVTVCDGERPAWSIKTSRGDITVDGYAHLWTPRFQILDQPVFFSPYAVIPVKTKRQSGFLMPEIGSSKRLGIFFNQPYYQVLNEEQDLTLFSNFMTNKGLMFGIEYRHATDIHSKGIWHLDALHDSQIENQSLFDDNANMERLNTNRWWARGKYDGYLGIPDWGLKVDLDLVSDQDYLREFSSGYSGYSKSRRAFLEYFGRDIEDKDSNLRLNRILLSRNWAHVGLQGLFEYTQNLNYSNNNNSPRMDHEYDPTIQRLPEINLNVYQVHVPSTPLYIEGSSQLTSFWREYGTTGTRFDIHPVISLPLHVEYGSVIPKAGWRGTAYSMQRFENDDEVDNDRSIHSRALPDFSASAYTEFSRIFSFADESMLSSDNGTSRWLKLKHAVQPRLEYTYIPYEDQDNLPYFDDLDRIEATNELRYSVSNIFTTKSGHLQPDPARQGALGAKFDYFEAVRLRFEQGYDFRESTRNDDLDDYPRRPFSDVLVDLTTYFTPWLSLNNKSWYSPYENRITEHEHTLSVYTDNKAYASFGLDFLDEIDEYKREDQEAVNIAQFSGGYAFNEHWSAAFLYRVDYEANTDLEKKLILRYDHQCFSTEGYFSVTDTDTRFGIFLNLAQLGSLGR